jgi:asparagine synthase (glutamine-hydrolysing)
LRSIGKDYPVVVAPDFIEQTASSESWFAHYAAAFAVDLSDAETGMRLDSGFTLPDLFMQKVDVATMAFGLEARCPFTDYRLVEWAMRLPLHYKIRRGETKYLLKKLLCRHLPREQVYQPKMGFGVPIANWLRGPLKDWSQSLIYDETLMGSLPLDKLQIRKLHLQQLNGERESHPLIWSVLMLLCFMQKHHRRESLPDIAYREVA